MSPRAIPLALIAAITLWAAGCTTPTPEWEAANPTNPLPEPPE